MIAVDVPAVDIGMAVIVGHHGPVLAVLGGPTGHPVELPGQHEGAILQELVLLAVQDDPAAVLDSVGGAAAYPRHRGRTRAHPMRMNDAFPGYVPVEPAERGHLGPGTDRPGNFGQICGSTHRAWSLVTRGHIVNLHLEPDGCRCCSRS